MCALSCYLKEIIFPMLGFVSTVLDLGLQLMQTLTPTHLHQLTHKYRNTHCPKNRIKSKSKHAENVQCFHSQVLWIRLSDTYLRLPYNDQGIDRYEMLRIRCTVSMSDIEILCKKLRIASSENTNIIVSNFRAFWNNDRFFFKDHCGSFAKV